MGEQRLLEDLVRAITWEEGELILLDQTKLPNEIVMEKQLTVDQVWDSIKKLKVRGAPAIGVAGAYGLTIGLKPFQHLGIEQFLAKATELSEYLDSSRPTAVNLSWGLRRMLAKAHAGASKVHSSAELYTILIQEAEQIHSEDIELCRNIGLHGAGLIQNGMGVLTHCNAGQLATSAYGTATSPMYVAKERGVNFKVYADETRPLLQGARLTSWELQQAGVDVTLICDNMAAYMMSKGFIDLVIVGADRVAANGDAANKIGTLGVAILANHYGIPFYVAIPASTYDPETASGESIIIEERGSEEVLFFGERRTGPKDMQVRNPAFDVTPHELITGIITDRGIVNAPYDVELKKVLNP